jgi:hypothetical protein
MEGTALATCNSQVELPCCTAQASPEKGALTYSTDTHCLFLACNGRRGGESPEYTCLLDGGKSCSVLSVYLYDNPLNQESSYVCVLYCVMKCSLQLVYLQHHQTDWALRLTSLHWHIHTCHGEIHGMNIPTGMDLRGSLHGRSRCGGLDWRVDLGWKKDGIFSLSSYFCTCMDGWISQDDQQKRPLLIYSIIPIKLAYASCRTMPIKKSANAWKANTKSMQSVKSKTPVLFFMPGRPGVLSFSQIGRGERSGPPGSRCTCSNRPRR